jgi:hypothetical protein
MTIEQKVRSLHCGFVAGLQFEEINNQKVLPINRVPFELETTVIKWLYALDEEQRRSVFIEDRLTEDGWSAFVSWMTSVLDTACNDPEFEKYVRTEYDNRENPIKAVPR